MKNGYYLIDTEDGHFWAIIHHEGEDIRAKFDTQLEAQATGTILKMIGFLDINEDFGKLSDGNEN